MKLLQFMYWLILSLSSVQLSLGCPKYSCKELDSDICARMDKNNTITLNQNVCEDGMICRLPSLYLWKYQAEIGDTLSCETAMTKEKGLQTFRVTCDERRPNRELAEGSNPKRCEVDEDCLMQDGNYTQCKCGLGGNAYCKPDISSSIFDNYWEGCEKEWGELSNYTTFTYAAMLNAFYSELVDPASCSNDIFLEMILIDDLKDGTRETFLTTEDIDNEDSASFIFGSVVALFMLA